MDELTKKEEMEDKKSARRAPPSAGASVSQDRGRRCNFGNFFFLFNNLFDFKYSSCRYHNLYLSITVFEILTFEK